MDHKKEPHRKVSTVTVERKQGNGRVRTALGAPASSSRNITAAIATNVTSSTAEAIEISPR